MYIFVMRASCALYSNCCCVTFPTKSSSQIICTPWFVLFTGEYILVHRIAWKYQVYHILLTKNAKFSTVRCTINQFITVTLMPYLCQIECCYRNRKLMPHHKTNTKLLNRRCLRPSFGKISNLTYLAFKMLVGNSSKALANSPVNKNRPRISCCANEPTVRVLCYSTCLQSFTI